MAGPKLKFYFREPNIDLNIPITDGTVKIGGFEWEFVPNGDEADAWDCGLAARVRAHAQGGAHISIPAFPNRSFGWLTSSSTASRHCSLPACRVYLGRAIEEEDL